MSELSLTERWKCVGIIDLRTIWRTVAGIWRRVALVRVTTPILIAIPAGLRASSTPSTMRVVGHVGGRKRVAKKDGERRTTDCGSPAPLYRSRTVQPEPSSESVVLRLPSR